MTCYSHLRAIPSATGVSIDDLPWTNPANAVCKTLHHIFVTIFQKEEDDQSMTSVDGLLLRGFAIPFLVVFVLASNYYEYPHLASRKKPEEESESQIKGDPKMTVLTLLFVLAPCLFVTFGPLFYLEDTKKNISGDGADGHHGEHSRLLNVVDAGATWVVKLHLLANPAGRFSDYIIIQNFYFFD